jgi:lipopolysaccharide/colanic/teichoic acid biosynthesis glycosyltransferase
MRALSLKKSIDWKKSLTLAINPNRRDSLVLLVLDVVSVVAVFNLIAFLRGVSAEPFLWALIGPSSVLIISLHLIDGYGVRADMLSVDYASLHLIASFSACVTTLILTFVFIPAGFGLQSSRAVILISFGILGPETLIYRRYLYGRTVVSRGVRKLIFVGEVSDFEVFSAECARMGAHTPLLHVDSREGYDRFGSVLDSISKSELQVEAIVVKESGRELPGEIPLKLVQLYFTGIPTYTLEIFHQVYWRKIPLYRINPIWLFQEGFRIAREPVFERIKRISDIALSSIGLLLSAPIVGLAALAIKFDDGGPVFFAQTRIGRHRIPFKLLKLRTMRQSSDPASDPYTRQGDARITRVGRLLRTARLDEFPQLWNVLRGQMSLIGPRAEWDRLVNEYEREIPSYHFRHLVKPGITGWAQVNYRYGTGVQDTLRKLEYDLYYIRNFSFMLDASIVLKTFHVMLLQKGR